MSIRLDISCRRFFAIVLQNFDLIGAASASWISSLGRSITTVRKEFIEQVGLIAQAEALPKIAGRVMGMLIFDGKDYSFSEIAEELDISRGSVSSSVSLLTAMGVIERTSKPGDRQDYFKLSDDPYTTFFNRALKRAEKAHQSIQQTRQSVPADKKEIRRRLKEYEKFYTTLMQALDGAAGSKD